MSAIFLLTFVFCLWHCAVSDGQDYDLPTKPNCQTISTLGGPYSALNSTGMIHQIPKIFWITMKSPPLHSLHIPVHMQRYLNLNPDWVPIIADDKQAHRFMAVVYANTSLLWAYERIHPRLGAARADIWRYAVLYACGGMYIDADASFNAQLDSFIKPTDEFILSTEANEAHPCYTDRFPSVEEPDILQKKVTAQWILIAAPRHLFLYTALVDVVTVVRSIHQRRSVLLPNLSPLQVIICTTGPLLLTNSIRKVITSAPANSSGFRYVGIDYAPVHANFKAKGFRNAEDHYVKLMQGGIPLLGSLQSHPATI